MSLDTVGAVRRIDALIEREAGLRDRARRIELDPLRQEAARELYDRANGLRTARLALLDRWRLR